MALFELEEGTSRKFYRIERVGTRVELHWGRIGTEGLKKTIELPTEERARIEYDAQVFQRRDRGYRLVVDESVPHDSEEAARAALVARSGPLTEHPRFMFRHAKRRAFSWLEVRGATLVIASGTVGTPAQPVERAFGSEAEAMRERDKLMGKLVGDGYELEMFATAPPPKRRPAGTTLRSHAALEALLLEDPDDEGSWIVFEDWLLSERDPTAEIIEYERANAAGDAAQARGAIAKLLFGAKAKTILGLIERPTWRGGYLRSCGFDASGARAAGPLQALVTAPAAKFLTELDLEASTFALLEIAGHAAALRRLRVHPEYQGRHVVDARHLAPLTRLERLQAEYVSEITYDPCLARLRQLWIRPTTGLDFDAVFSQPWTALETLGLDLGEHHEPPRWDLALPGLQSLEIVAREGPVALGVVEQLAGAELGSQLRLKIQSFSKTRKLSQGELATFYGGAFAHLASVELPAAIIEQRP